MYRFIFLHVDIQSFQHNLMKRLIFSPLNCLCSLVKDQFTIFVCVYFWSLYSPQLINLSFFFFPPTPNYLIIVNFEVGQCQSSNCHLLFLLLWYCVRYSGSFVFLCKLRISLFISTKQPAGIVRTVGNLHINLARTDILILSLLTHKHRTFLHLFRSLIFQQGFIVFCIQILYIFCQIST